MAEAKTPGEAGGVLLLTRQVLDPTYKPDVFQDPVQRLAFIRMIGMARYVDNGTLMRGQLRESVRQLSEQCEMSRMAIVRLLGRLEDDGAIRRERSDNPKIPDTITVVNFEAWQTALTGGTRASTINSNELQDRSTSGTRKRGKSGTHSGTRASDGAPTTSGTKADGVGTHSGTRPRGSSGTSITKELPDNEEQITSSAAGASAPVPWSTTACDSWIRHMDGTAPGGEIGNHLKPLVEKYGADEVLQQWDAYLATHVRQLRGPFAKPADFAQRYGYYKKHGHKLDKPNGGSHGSGSSSHGGGSETPSRGKARGPGYNPNRQRGFDYDD